MSTPHSLTLLGAQWTITDIAHVLGRFGVIPRWSPWAFASSVEFSKGDVPESIKQGAKAVEYSRSIPVLQASDSSHAMQQKIRACLAHEAAIDVALSANTGCDLVQALSTFKAADISALRRVAEGLRAAIDCQVLWSDVQRTYSQNGTLPAKFSILNKPLVR